MLKSRFQLRLFQISRARDFSGRIAPSTPPSACRSGQVVGLHIGDKTPWSLRQATFMTTSLRNPSRWRTTSIENCQALIVSITLSRGIGPTTATLQRHDLLF
jgi:hypothetical protein